MADNPRVEIEWRGEGDPDQDVAVLLLLQEIRDHLETMAAALVPSDEDKPNCPACGSSYVTRKIHDRGPDFCSRGVCVRWLREKPVAGWEPHFVANCEDCKNEWVEAIDE